MPDLTAAREAGVAVLALFALLATLFYGSKIVALLGNHLSTKLDDQTSLLREIRNILAKDKTS